MNQTIYVIYALVVVLISTMLSYSNEGSGSRGWSSGSGHSSGWSSGGSYHK